MSLSTSELKREILFCVFKKWRPFKIFNFEYLEYRYKKLTRDKIFPSFNNKQNVIFIGSVSRRITKLSTNNKMN